jgi:hypothetical protein
MLDPGGAGQRLAVRTMSVAHAIESSPLGRAFRPGGAALDHLRAGGEPIHRDGGLKMPLVPSTEGPRSPWRRSRPPFVGQAIQKDGHRLDCELRDHGAWGVEGQIYREREFLYGRRWPSRALPVEEADDQKVE